MHGPIIEPVATDSGKTIRVVRDDLVEGGTKARVLADMLRDCSAEEFVYPAVADGFGPVALAAAGKALGKKVTLVTAERKTLTPNLVKARELGAQLIYVPFPKFYEQDIVPFAQGYAEHTAGAMYVPSGFKGLEGMEDALATLARSTGEHPKEIWCVGGSGTLARALQKAWPDATCHVVDVVKNGVADFGNARVIEAAQSFSQKLRKADLPPFPSVRNYDAKAWPYVQAHASDGALFWNVAAELELPKRDLRFLSDLMDEEARNHQSIHQR